MKKKSILLMKETSVNQQMDKDKPHHTKKARKTHINNLMKNQSTSLSLMITMTKKIIKMCLISNLRNNNKMARFAP